MRKRLRSPLWTLSGIDFGGFSGASGSNFGLWAASGEHVDATLQDFCEHVNFRKEKCIGKSTGDPPPQNPIGGSGRALVGLRENTRIS